MVTCQSRMKRFPILLLEVEFQDQLRMEMEVFDVRGMGIYVMQYSLSHRF
jgi:hypothetical protein